MDQFLVRSSIFYVIYNDPLPTPLWRHSTKPQCRGPITWQCSIFFICRRNDFYIVFLSRIHDSISLNHLMMFVGHWWMDSHYFHIIKVNLNKSKPKIDVLGPNHWPKKWSFIDVGVTMTPGWPCNKPDLTMKETTLYSAAMTPGKHGPHKYPWSFARLQYPKTYANTTSGRQYYRYITSLPFFRNKQTARKSQ